MRFSLYIDNQLRTYWLMLNNYLLCFGSFASAGHEEVNAIGFVFHRVGVREGITAVVGFKAVDESSLHVVDFDIDLASQMLKVERH